MFAASVGSASAATMVTSAASSISRSRAGPVERDVLARIGRPLEVVAERLDRADRRFAPGQELRAGAGFAARRVHHLRVFAGVAGRPGQRVRPGLDLADDLDPPM